MAREGALQRSSFWTGASSGEGDDLAGSRGLAILPDCKRLITANYHGNTIAVLDCDMSAGTVTVRQVLKDDENGVHALEGAFGVATSADGKFVYTSSGRFVGDQAVCAFVMKGDGTLTVLQEFTARQENFGPFRGGNDIVVSPDGRNVYVVATESGSLACLERTLIAAS